MPAHFTPLRRIETSGGEVMKALHAEESDFTGLGEAYFSRVNADSVRGWKCHNEMTVNVVVPVGHVRFVVETGGSFEAFDLGPDHDYGRLTIQPGTWFGFQGGADGGLVLNLANIIHRPDEANGKELDEFDYDWTRNEAPRDNVGISSGSDERNTDEHHTTNVGISSGSDEE